jgi:hypothetical protein
VGAGPSSRLATSEPDSFCEHVQAELIAGELSASLQQHVNECSACRFVARLSERFAGASATAGGWSLSAAAPESIDALTEGIVGRYRLLALLGGGGQGRVFRARDTTTDDEVACKIVRLPDPDAKVLEVAYARRVRHPNVCRVFHAERLGDLQVIVMELLEGPTLAAAMSSLGRGARLAMFRGVCDGVAAAHDAGVLHLDIKPENILLHRGAPVVTDFGLSTLASGGARAHGGTLSYMAPEQRAGRPVDTRADVYALGRVLQRLLGDRPGVLRSVIERATAADARARHKDAHALLTDFDARLQARRRRTRVALSLVAASTLLPLAAFVVPPPRGPRAAYPAAYWGNDLIPSGVWNVAHDAGGRRGIRLTASHPGFACGQSLADLVDGLTDYHDWKHGFAFPPRPPGACISMELLGTCGARDPDAHLCAKGDNLGTRLDERVGSLT